MIESLRQHIKDNVSSINGIYPNVAPQNIDGDIVVYSIVYDKPIKALGGRIVGRKSRFQFDLYSKKYSQIKSIKEEIENALYSFSFDVSDLSVMDDYEHETKLHKQIFDFTIKQ